MRYHLCIPQVKWPPNGRPRTWNFISSCGYLLRSRNCAVNIVYYTWIQKSLNLTVKITGGDSRGLQVASGAFVDENLHVGGECLVCTERTKTFLFVDTNVHYLTFNSLTFFRGPGPKKYQNDYRRQ